MSLSSLLRKGAIIGMDKANPLASIIRFQYNPERLTRTVVPSFGPEGGSPAETMRLHGAPRETLQLEIEIDASDHLEQGHPITTRMGVFPQLAALEMLVSPKSLTVVRNLLLLRAGMKEVLPPVAPVALFVWGPKRVLPTRITQLTIQEEGFDSSLNPINARVGLTMQVLTYSDVPPDHPAFALFMGNQVLKEGMAVLGSGMQLFDAALTAVMG